MSELLRDESVGVMQTPAHRAEVTIEVRGDHKVLANIRPAGRNGEKIPHLQYQIGFAQWPSFVGFLSNGKVGGVSGRLACPYPSIHQLNLMLAETHFITKRGEPGGGFPRRHESSLRDL